MAGSRLEKIGTIFSRVTGLLRAGAMDVNEKPIWYDVYRAFPPKLEPSYSRIQEDVKLKEILYPEDIIRVKLHKKLGKKLPGYNLKDRHYSTVSQRIIFQTLKYQQENNNLTEDEALEKAIEDYNNEIRQFKADDLPDIKPKYGYLKDRSGASKVMKKPIETKIDLKKILDDTS